MDKQLLPMNRGANTVRLYNVNPQNNHSKFMQKVRWHSCWSVLYHFWFIIISIFSELGLNIDWFNLDCSQHFSLNLDSSSSHSCFCRPCLWVYTYLVWSQLTRRSALKSRPAGIGCWLYNVQFNLQLFLWSQGKNWAVPHWIFIKCVQGYDVSTYFFYIYYHYL